MKTIRQNQFGGPDVLELVETPPPTALPTEIVVRTRAVGLNPVETYIRSGQFPLLGPPPFVLGWDLSGVVVDVVPGTHRFAVGDEVFGMPLFPRAANAYAELVAVPAHQLVRKPRSLDHLQAAALPLAGLTAWQSLIDVAQLGRDQRVLIHAAGGGVGHLAVQLAKHRGAYVIATASETKHDFVRSLGADEIIDYRRREFSEVVRDVDVVLDAVGGDIAVRSLATLRPRGLLVTLVERTNAALAARTRDAGRRFAGVAVDPDRVALAALAALADAGALRVHVEQVFPFAEVAHAHERLESGSVTGKLVLRP
jgi:NADPH:quinone reductase-like Zn-dependent oxidoreductase